MRIEAYSEDSIAIAKFTKPYAIISIADVANYPAELPLNNLCQGVLRLAFYDIYPGEFPGREMTTEHARTIWKFVRSVLDNVEIIVVQCVYGESRSAAIAAAISLKINGNTSDFFTSPQYFPNKYVYNLMLEYREE